MSPDVSKPVAPTVTTTSGEVRGLRRGMVSAWLGVPYAAPPVGELRFREPQPHLAWSGVRSAEAYGPAAMQPKSLIAPAAKLGDGTSEDCLYLNVFSPGADDERRPVLVWIHGGAYTSGSGAMYDGAHLAALGDVVVVTVNYRLGVFGFVDLGSATGADVASNLGLRDQISALRWVRDNISAFGGDPDRVTVAGESAGSVSVSLLLAAPSAAGLFRAAIMESGSYSLIHGPEVSTEIAGRYVERLGVATGGGSALWELPAAELVEAQVAIDKASPGTVAAAPWFDADLVPGSLEEARVAQRPEVALLAGHNHDEVSLFQVLPSDIMPTTRAKVAARLDVAVGPARTAQVLAAYPDTRVGNRALGTDFNFAMPTIHFADRHAVAGGTTYFYRFDAAVPLLGATHASELPYLWDWEGAAAYALRGRPTRARRDLGLRMRQHWVAFVRDGRPGADWPVHDLTHRHTRIFDPRGDRTEADPERPRRLAWAGEDIMPRA